MVHNSFHRKSTYAALDIGSSKVSCVIAKVIRDRIEVVGYGYNASKGMKNGIVTDVNEALISVCNAVESAEQMANERIDKVYVNVSGDKIKSYIRQGVVTLNKKRPVNEADIQKVISKGVSKINTEGHSLIHCLPTSYHIDFGEEIKDPTNIYGEHLSVDVLLGFLPEAQYKNLSTVIDGSHLEIAGKAFNAYASGLACLLRDEMELGATVIDIGGGTTAITTFYNGFPRYFSAIGVGGNNISKDIAIGLTTSFTHAERLKTLHGCAFLSSQDEGEMINVYPLGEEDDSSIRQVSKAELNNIISPRVEEMFEIVADKLAAHGLKDASSHRVVLTGGCSQLAGIRDVASVVLDKPVRLARPKNVMNLPEKLYNPAFSTCIGLLLFAINHTEKEPIKLINKTSTQTGSLSKIFGWIKNNY